MINMKAGFAFRIQRIGIVGRGSAQLTRVTVSLQNLNTQLSGNSSTDCRQWDKSFKDIFARLQVGPIDVRLDLHTVFIAKFSYAALVIPDSRNFGKLVSGNDFPDVFLKVSSEF